MTPPRWPAASGRSLALIAAGAASGCLVELWLQLLVGNRAFFEPGSFRLGAPFQDGLVISQCASATDCDVVQSLQYPVAMAANYLLTAVAFALLARSSAVGGLIAAIAGGVILSLVMTSVVDSPTLHADYIYSPAIVWMAVLVGSAASSTAWVLMRRRTLRQPEARSADEG